MGRVDTKIRGCLPMGRETVAYFMDRPPGFDYAAGQFIEVTIPHDRHGWVTRAFTLASAPHEDHLMFATRMNGSEFKDQLRSAIGKDVIIEGPFGNLTLRNETDERAVMFAGGIGVTPFRSMIIDAAHRRITRAMMLFHANRRYGDALFKDEILFAGKRLKALRYVPVFSREGDRERISYELIKKHGADRKNDSYYIAGSPRFVGGIRRMLLAVDIPKSAIRMEEFPGY